MLLYSKEVYGALKSAGANEKAALEADQAVDSIAEQTVNVDMRVRKLEEYSKQTAFGSGVMLTVIGLAVLVIAALQFRKFYALKA